MAMSLSNNQSSPSMYVLQGLEAFFSGDRVRALQLMVRAIEHDSNDEHAWLGLARIVTAPERRRYCLEQALLINPHNLRTRMALRDVRGMASPSVLTQAVQQIDEVVAATLELPQDGEYERAVGDTGASWYALPVAGDANMAALSNASPVSVELTPFSMEHIEQLLRNEGSKPSASASDAADGASKKRRSTPSVQPLQLRPVTFADEVPVNTGTHPLDQPKHSATGNDSASLSFQGVAESAPLLESLLVDGIQPEPAPALPRAIAENLRATVHHHDPAYRYQVFGALFFFGALSLLLFAMLLAVGRIPVA